MKIIISACLFLMSCSAFADEFEEGNRRVASIRFDQDSIYVRFIPAPDGCDGRDDMRMHAHINQQSSNKTVLVSGLLAAYSNDLEISHIFYQEGGSCGEGRSLELTAFELKAMSESKF